MRKQTGKEILQLVSELITQTGLTDAATIAFAILQREAEVRTQNNPGTAESRNIEEMNQLETMVVELRGYYREERAAIIDGIQPTYEAAPNK